MAKKGPKKPRTPRPALPDEPIRMIKDRCPVTRGEFAQHAKPIVVNIEGATVTFEPKLFSTGSFGWNAHGKLTLILNGKEVRGMMGFNIVIVGSKEAKLI